MTGLVLTTFAALVVGTIGLPSVVRFAVDREVRSLWLCNNSVSSSSSSRVKNKKNKNCFAETVMLVVAAPDVVVAVVVA